MSKSAIVFLHGFKGFKDWGCWPLMEDWFRELGYDFYRLNFSKNGTTEEYPLDFVDLEAFGQNNFTQELSDVQVYLDKLEKEYKYENFHLIGHSRGGGVAMYYASKDERVKSVVTLASVATFGRGFEELEEWKEKGVKYIYNGRTKQNMPLYYQLYEDYSNNYRDKDVLSVLSQLNRPHLIIHAMDDSVVDFSSAQLINNARQNSQLVLLEKGGHTFGTRHPWVEKTMPFVFIEVLDTIHQFYVKNWI